LIELQQAYGQNYERWKRIPGFPHYQASTLGRIRSIDRKTWQPNPRTGEYSWFPKRGRVLRPGKTVKGYPYVNLCEEGKITNKLVHILVARTFHGKCPEGQEVRHKDGVKVNVKPTNLEYGTPLQNGEDSRRLGLCKRGEDHHTAVLTTAQVRRIKRVHQSRHPKYGTTPLSKKYSVSKGTINQIVAGKRWAWL
jgi:hypothetical protein